MPFRRKPSAALDAREEEVKRFLRDKLAGRAPAIADALGVPPQRLRSYYERGRASRYFPAALVRGLFLATGCDADVAEEFLLHGTGRSLRTADDREGPPPGRPPASLDRALVELGEMKGRIDRLYLEASSEDSEDGVAISDAENDDLRAALKALVDRAEELRRALKRTRPDADHPPPPSGR